MQLSEIRARSIERRATMAGLTIRKHLASLDNTAPKGISARERSIDRSAMSAAYHGVVDKDKDATIYARKAARELVKLLKAQGDLTPPRKLVSGMLLKTYNIKADKLKHAMDIVYETIDKLDKREEQAQYA